MTLVASTVTCLLADLSKDVDFALACLSAVCGVLLLFPIVLFGSVTGEYLRQPSGEDERRSFVALLHDHWLFQERRRATRVGNGNSNGNAHQGFVDHPPDYHQALEAVAVQQKRSGSVMSNATTIPPSYDEALHI